MTSLNSEPRVITFGCRLNSYESQVIRQHALAQGITNTIIFNTCTVTNEAERQSRQAIRKARREHPNAQIIVTGCSAQVNAEMYAAMPEVDRVMGNLEKMQVESYAIANHPKVVVSDIMEVKETAHHLISGFESRVRAFVEIQNGCDHRCTFCKIPYARGNNRSVPIGEIAKQVRILVENGCREVVFTGVDITGYGNDLPGQPTLGQMTRRVLAQVPELPRLRLSSIDPAEVDDDVWRLIAEEPRLMPHLHISLQAGDDMILKRMKRRHLRADVIKFCQRARQLRPEIVFGADIIAGFPTETKIMHQNSLRIVEECDLTYLHVFPYSAREGTPAVRMPQVPKDIIKQRAASLRQLGKQALNKFMRNKIGKTAQVLIEKNDQGRSEQYVPVHVTQFSSSCNDIGNIVEVHITDVAEKTLIGKQYEQRS